MWQDIQVEINKKNNQVQSRKEGARAEVGNLSPPWYVYMGGHLAAIVWGQAEIARIESDLNGALNDRSRSTNGLKNLQWSGLTFEGNTLTWIQVWKPSAGTYVYSILNRLRAQLGNPTLYAFLKMGWKELSRIRTRSFKFSTSAHIGGHCLRQRGGHPYGHPRSTRQRARQRTLRTFSTNSINFCAWPMPATSSAIGTKARRSARRCST